MAIKKYYDSDCNLGVLDGKTCLLYTSCSRKRTSACWSPARTPA